MLIRNALQYGLAAATAKPVVIIAPSITGTAQVAQTLGGDNGVWTQSPTGFAYKWQNSPDNVTWTDIAGAVAATYSPVVGDAAKFVRRGVLASNSFGSAVAGYSFSAASAAVIAAGGGATFSFPLSLPFMGY